MNLKKQIALVPCICARRSKNHHPNEDLSLSYMGEDEEEEEDDDDNVDEEVDFDTPSFDRGQIFSDYAEDMDFDQ